MIFRKSLLILGVTLLSYASAAQHIAVADSAAEPIRIKWAELSHPQKAGLASMVLPGAGQIVNRQVWKAPIAWSLMGASGYWWYSSQSTLNRLNQAIDIRFDSDPTTVDEFDGVLNDFQLFNYQSNYQTQRDYSILILLGAYSFQALEAYAAGFLVDFDVTPNLSVQPSPAVTPEGLLGAKLTFTWH